MVCFSGRSSLAAEIPAEQRRSSYEAMSSDTKAMQDDDTSNPASLWVLDGETLWSARAGAACKSCADCHGAHDTVAPCISPR